jgi:hypothetical protein
VRRLDGAANDEVSGSADPGGERLRDADLAQVFTADEPTGQLQAAAGEFPDLGRAEPSRMVDAW